jgi:hypothetical protein
MLEYITLGLVLLKYALDYIAPRTKNKVDDKADEVLDLLPLPSLPDAAKAAKDQYEKDTSDAPASKPVEGFGVARDHRK